MADKERFMWQKLGDFVTLFPTGLIWKKKASLLMTLFCGVAVPFSFLGGSLEPLRPLGKLNTPVGLNG